MKTLLNIVTLLLFCCGCKDTKPKEETTRVLPETEKIEKANSRIEDDLSNEKEKIILLSEVRKISFDTLNLILRDYYVLTDTISDSDQNSKFLYQSAIAKISDRYKISKSKIASLIFSYKYEMLTKEDIGESAMEDFKDNYEEEQYEPEDRY